MSSHTAHESLPGFDPEQIYHDGCPECERRGAEFATALNYLDGRRFIAAWARATAWQRDDAVIPSAAEADLLRNLWAVQVMFERFGISELGRLPRPTVLAPIESVVLTIAKSQIGRDEEVPPNTTAMLVMALERLSGGEDWTAEANANAVVGAADGGAP